MRRRAGCSTRTVTRFSSGGQVHRRGGHGQRREALRVCPGGQFVGLPVGRGRSQGYLQPIRSRSIVKGDVDLLDRLEDEAAQLTGEAPGPRAAAPPAVPMRRTVAALLRKELLVELRSLQSVPGMALFAVSTFVVFHFALNRNSVDGDLAAGILWVTLLFAAMLGVNLGRLGFRPGALFSVFA